MAFVTLPGHEGALAVVSRDRSLLAFPCSAVYRTLTEPAPNTIALTLNMLANGGGPPAQPGDYATVLV
ncbi:MAG: hypothetical protein AB8I08_05960 [Sandaracinaceae bacterium]